MELPSTWDETAYISHNRDVALAVARGQFPTGWHHYAAYGKAEGRDGHWLNSSAAPQVAVTRACRDPWNYLEITDTHGLKPCCIYPVIAQWEPSGPGIDELRNSKPFLELRRSLMTGDLSPICRNCHIRAEVPAELAEPAAESQAQLRPERLRHLRIAITTRCNLRCVYCAVSQPGYKGVDMSVEVFEDVLAMANDLDRNAEIIVNGHGETTYHPEWMTLCGRLTKMGFHPSIITNLARPLDAPEAECLARFGVIQISVDTVDEKQLAELRRRVRLSTIVENVARIRQAAQGLSIDAPKFSLSCGVFDVNYAGLEDLADFAIEYGVHSVTFWELVKYADIPGATNVNSVTILDAASVARAVACLERALAKLNTAGIETEVAGEFLDKWRRMDLRSPKPQIQLTP